MKATIKWAGKASFEGRSESGHTVVMDGSPEIGGENRGPRPMEMLLLGMGGCTSIDVMLILGKARQDVTDCVVQIEAERAPAEPKVFTRIHAHFVVTGRSLDPKRVAQAIQLSAEKYCSASIMLGKTAAMSHDFEIVEVE
jgi:putative redox protein